MNLEFIGWVKEGVHDKVYVGVFAEGKFYTAWGRRDAKLQFKKFPNSYEWNRILDKKRGRYKPIDKLMLFTFFPDFQERVEEELVMKVMAGKVK